LGQELHYSPEEDLAQVDAQLIASAKTSIDFASYALTDRVIIEALTGTDHRGVAIRIVLDPREGHDFIALSDLSDNVRIKRGGPIRSTSKNSCPAPKPETPDRDARPRAIQLPRTST
jgi:phosphatidylserine/phosphatidylglycerophosphate/cardiolipin synthase-like enzyme